MHDHSSRRFGVPSHTGYLGAALAACLCAGQLAASAPIRPAAASTTGAAQQAHATGTAAAPAPTDAEQRDRVAAAARARAAVAGAAKAADRAGRKPASRATSDRRTVTGRQGHAVRTDRPATVPSTTTAAASRILAEARRHIGTPYRFGASGPDAFDCSGFTQYVFARSVGFNLPHRADAQQDYGWAVSRSAARPGDLIFFRNGTFAYHVGIYAGGGYMYDAPRAGKPVGKHKIWSSRYVVRRLVG